VAKKGGRIASSSLHRDEARALQNEIWEGIARSSRSAHGRRGIAEQVADLVLFAPPRVGLHHLALPHRLPAEQRQTVLYCTDEAAPGRTLALWKGTGASVLPNSLIDAQFIPLARKAPMRDLTFRASMPNLTKKPAGRKAQNGITDAEARTFEQLRACSKKPWPNDQVTLQVRHSR